MKWKFTVIQHAPRIAMRMSLNEYAVCDAIYKTQTHPEFGFNGWARLAYSDLAEAIGISKSSAARIVARMESRGLIEVNPIDPNLKQATSTFYDIAYLDTLPTTEQLQHFNNSVPKRNDAEASRNGTQPVPKRNATRPETERNPSRNGTPISNSKKLKKEEVGKGATRTAATSTGFKYLGEMADRLTPLLESGQVDVRAAFAAVGIEPTVPQIRQHVAEWWSYCQQQNTRVARADELAQWRHFRDRWIPNITSPTIRRKAGDKEPPRRFDYSNLDHENDL